MGKKLYVGNLPFSATEQDLSETFAECGTVDSVKIITDRDTGRSKGFGFVEMSTDDEAKAAIASRNEADIEDEIGDLLFAVVNLARKCQLDAENTLQKATDKFVARFNLVEKELKAQGKKLGEANLAELDEIWNRVKYL